MYFNHYHGCAKCVTRGKWDAKGKHMSFPNINADRRTDESYRNRIDEDHHKENSPLESLPINMIDDFPVADSLHLIDLGIMKKCLVGWSRGSFNFRTKWSGRDIEEVSNLLFMYNMHKPIEIHRAIRKIECVKFWKALEFRTFFLYLSIVVLKDYLSVEVYNHFLLLFCSITICTSKSYHKYIDLAEIMLNDYIEQYKIIYGEDSINSNVHNLCHLVDDVRKFGPLPQFSAYPFENRLNYIKRLLRNGNRPLAQVAKRLTELSYTENKKNTPKQYPIVTKEIKNSDNCYASIEIKDGFTIKNDKKNKWFLTKNNELIAMNYVKKIDGQFHVYGENLKKLNNFFDRPFNSSTINIYSADVNMKIHQPVSLTDIKCKMFSLPYKKQLIFVPLIHTLD